MRILHPLPEKRNSILPRLPLLLFVCLLCFACGKDKDGPKEPDKGYFAKTIQLVTGEGEMKFALQYDNQNRLVQENVTFGTDGIKIRYEYNPAGQLIKAWWDDEPYGTFEYEGNILTKLIAPASGTDPEQIYPVTHTDGTYQAMDGSIRFTVDGNRQLRYHESTKTHYTYTDKPGVHRHLPPQPVWFMGELGSFSFYSLLVSQQEIATVILRGDEYEVRNKRDAQDNITQVEMVEKATGTVGLKWEVTYEQRELAE